MKVPNHLLERKRSSNLIQKIVAICIMLIALLLMFAISKNGVKAAEKFGELYELDGEYVIKVLPQTTLQDFKNNMQTDEAIEIQNSKGVALQDNELVGSKMTLKMGGKTYKLVVIGDIDGNGKITITDLVKMNLYSVKLMSLTDDEIKAADVNNDKKISITDLVQLKLITANIKDIIAPVTFVPTAEVTNNSITVRGTVVDVNSGIGEVYFKLDDGEWVQNADKTQSTYTFTNVDSSEHKVRMKVKDNEGNTKITQAVDASTVKGKIKIYPSTTAWTNKDISVSIDYTTNVANVKKQISVDGGQTFREYTEPVTVSENTQVVAQIQNNAGKVIATEKLEIKNIDRRRPNDFTIMANLTNRTIKVEAITEDAQADTKNGQSGLKEYEYIIKKGLWKW